MVMNRDGENLLCVILTDDIIVQDFANIDRCRQPVLLIPARGFFLVPDDVTAQSHTLIADEDRRASNELAHLMLALPAERTKERLLGIRTATLVHCGTPGSLPARVPPAACVVVPFAIAKGLSNACPFRTAAPRTNQPPR